MKDRDELVKKLIEIAGRENVKTDEPMSAHTTFQAGGAADVFVMPENAEEARDIISCITEYDFPYYIVGNGSNLLVSDDGFRGVIVNIGRNISEITIDGVTVTAGAGAPLIGISNEAQAAGLTGMEFASGIPGTLGGACVMNAGAYGGEMKDILKEVTVLDRNGEIRVIPASDLELGYRTSSVIKNGYVVLEAKIELKRGDPDEIRSYMDGLTEQRKSKQPLEYPSAGSTFKRPEGYFAGKLISDAGLKGAFVGGAQVSEKHAGFIINTNHATAKDIMDLIELVQKNVYDMFGVELEREVRILGDFGRER